MSVVEHACPNCDGIGHLFTAKWSEQIWAHECPVCEGRGKVVSAAIYWGTVSALELAQTALHKLCLARGSTDGYGHVFEAINAALAAMQHDHGGPHE